MALSHLKRHEEAIEVKLPTHTHTITACMMSYLRQSYKMAFEALRNRPNEPKSFEGLIHQNIGISQRSLGQVEQALLSFQYCSRRVL